MAVSNLERFRKDIDNLLERGEQLEVTLLGSGLAKGLAEDLLRALKQEQKGKPGSTSAGKPGPAQPPPPAVKASVKPVVSFQKDYQTWYSEALALLHQVLPQRVADFVRHYEKPKNRKSLDGESYRIEDCLQGLSVTRGYDNKVLVDASAAIPHFQQQLAIVLAAKSRFESSLFEIRQLVQADLLDSEIEAAEVLAKQKFTRAAGAVVGVVLERHLAQVCTDHGVIIKTKKPTLADLNEALKAHAIIEIPDWRFIQHLADIRNLCDHHRSQEPTMNQVNDLIAGAKKVTKSIA